MSQYPKDDCFAPPDAPCEVYCLHCKRVYDSSLIRYVRVPGPMVGHWCCPVPECGGRGYTFDIFPTDPTHEDNAGWVSFDDDECEDDADYSADLEESAAAAATAEQEALTSEWIAAEAAESAGEFEPAKEWTPEADIDDYDDADAFDVAPTDEDMGKPFTMLDFQRALDAGVYERSDEALRREEAEQDERERSATPKQLNNDDDIPF